MSMSLFWLIAMVLFGVLEAVTVGLTSIWFALGALGALAAAAAAAPDEVIDKNQSQENRTIPLGRFICQGGLFFAPITTRDMT